MFDIILKEARWINASEDWLEKEVRNPATGKMVKVKSLPTEERKKYAPKKDFHNDLTDKARKHLPSKLDYDADNDPSTDIHVKPHSSKSDHHTLTVSTGANGIDRNHVKNIHKFLKEHGGAQGKIDSKEDTMKSTVDFHFKNSG